MARRNTTTEPTEEAPVSAETVEATEATETTETATEAAPQKKEEVVIDLTAFQTATAAAVAESDPATGTIALSFIEPVVMQYRLLDGLKAKNAAKAWLSEMMKEGMANNSIQIARAYFLLQESMTAGPTGKATSSTPKAPVVPTEAFVNSEATLRLAAELHVPGEGVAENHENLVDELLDSVREAATAYLAWVTSTDEDKGEEPEVNAVVKTAVKLALGKAAKTGGRAPSTGSGFTGERRDIGKHISSAFEGVAPGTFLTVAEIKNHKSEEYGDGSPSAGAISARLFPSSGKCTVPGVTPSVDDKGKKGAIKDAE